jgi:hypothetical protein
MKLSRTLIILGIAILTSSLLSYYHFGMGSYVDLGDYEGSMFRTGGSFHLVVMSEQGTELTVYVLTGQDVLTAIRDASLAQVSPIHFVENILYYETIVETYSPGWYGVLVTPTHNETAEYEIEVEPVSPDSGLFAYGLVTMIIGIVPIATTKILERRRSFHHVQQSNKD